MKRTTIAMPSSILDLRSSLSEDQLSILEKVWESHLIFGAPLSFRKLQHNIGKKDVNDVLKGVSRSLLFDTESQGARLITITALGALMTQDGSNLFGLFLSLLELTNELYAKEPDRNEIPSSLIVQELGLGSNKEEEKFFNFLTLLHAYSSPITIGSYPQGGAWSLRITEQVTELYLAEYKFTYAAEIFLSNYQKNTPWSQRDQIWALAADPLDELSKNSGVEVGVASLPKRLSSSGPESSVFEPTRKSRPILFETAYDAYVIDGPLLGEGGAGRVHSVRNEDGQKLALKCLFPERITTERRKRFKNESAFCRSFRHRNIIHVLDSGLTEIDGVKCPFYVMPEFTLTLRKLIAQGLPKERILPLFSQILDGIDAAHKLGVIHRDIKPENILYDPEKDLVVIADFGIAHFEEDFLETLVQTRLSAKMANLGYAAPEQRVKGASIDQRADIFALGLILNEMFTGAVPHGSGYQTIGAIFPELEFLDQLVDRMIRNDPNARPDSIETIKKELIARGIEFIALQQLDAKTKEVIPAFVAEKITPMKIVSVDWKGGNLILECNRYPDSAWLQRFWEPKDEAKSVLRGLEPDIFIFGGDKAIKIKTTADMAAPILEIAKEYFELTNRDLQTYLDEAAARLYREAQDKLKAEHAVAEERVRVLSKLKL
jgi:hypothetical protein